MKKRASGPAVATTEPRKAGKAALVKKRSVSIESKQTQRMSEPAIEKPKRKSRRAEDRIDLETLTRCPKRIVCELLGRVSENGSVNIKVVNGWVATYGMPAEGEEVNLFVLLKWFGDRLAKFGRIEGGLEALEDGSEEGEEGSMATWTLANLKAKHANTVEDTRWKEIRNNRAEGELLDQAVMRQALSEMAGTIFELFQELMDRGEPIARLAEAAYRQMKQCVEKVSDRTFAMARSEPTGETESASPDGHGNNAEGAGLVSASVPTEEAAGNHPVRRRRGRPRKRSVQPEGT